MGGNVESRLGNLVRLTGSCAPDDREAARARQAGLEGIEGVYAYRALVEAPVRDVGLFGVGKKGVPSLAARSAA